MSFILLSLYYNGVSVMTLPKWQKVPFRKADPVYGQSLCQIKKMKIMSVTILNIKKINLILRPNDEKKIGFLILYCYDKGRDSKRDC